MNKLKESKRLGQHWLFDETVLNSIVAAGQVKPGDIVLEIGPGLGTLTDVLLQKGAMVTAIEFDIKLVAKLIKKYQNNPNIKILSQDIMEFDFNQLPGGYKIVANIPYYLTSALLRLISEVPNSPQIAVLLVQKEVAQRVCAGPGQMSVLSVTTQMYFEPLLGQIVRAELFAPPPKVDSQVLILKRRAVPLFGGQEPKAVFRIVKAGFSERRKKLRSSLSGGLGISKTEAEAMLTKAGIDPSRRAQELTLQDWLELSGLI